MPPIFSTKDNIKYTPIMYGENIGSWRAWFEHTFIEREGMLAAASMTSPIFVKKKKSWAIKAARQYREDNDRLEAYLWKR